MIEWVRLMNHIHVMIVVTSINSKNDRRCEKKQSKRKKEQFCRYEKYSHDPILSDVFFFLKQSEYFVMNDIYR
jgi:hypothetical protein